MGRGVCVCVRGYLLCSAPSQSLSDEKFRKGKRKEEGRASERNGEWMQKGYVF